MMSHDQEVETRNYIERMFNMCANDMRKRKNYRITPDFLAEEASDRLRICEPEWFVKFARAWLAQQDWFKPDADGGFWTEK